MQLSLGARLRAIGGLEQGQLVAGPLGDLSSDLHLLLQQAFAMAHEPRGLGQVGRAFVP